MQPFASEDGASQREWHLVYSETMATSTITTEKLDWTGCSLIRREPGKLGGAPNVNGKRITPETFVEHWNSGDSVNDILDTFDMDRYEVETVLRFADQNNWLVRPFVP